MTTPVCTATPYNAMYPTHTATEKLYPSHHCKMTPPVIAYTTDSMTIVASEAEWNVMYSSMKMMKKTRGTRILSRSRARTWNSYCPVQRSVYPEGSLNPCAMAVLALSTYTPMSPVAVSTYTYPAS